MHTNGEIEIGDWKWTDSGLQSWATRRSTIRRSARRHSGRMTTAKPGSHVTVRNWRRWNRSTTRYVPFGAATRTSSPKTRRSAPKYVLQSFFHFLNVNLFFLRAYLSINYSHCCKFVVFEVVDFDAFYFLSRGMSLNGAMSYLNWAELNWPEQVDPHSHTTRSLVMCMRQCHNYTSYWLAAAKLGRLVLSQFSNLNTAHRRKSQQDVSV